MRGAANGSRPSRISSSASAVQSESGTQSPRSPGRRARRRLACSRVLEVLEEFGARIEHHQVALVAKRRLVRLEAAVERIKLGILGVRLRVDRRCLRIARALDLLCL